VARRYLIRHPRSRIARWTRRVLGIAATVAVLAVGVMIASMVLSVDGDDDSTTSFPAAIPVHKAGKHHGHRGADERRDARPGT
jgi:hypothetical protein